jgi:tagatose-6-phosphate ketose/aldose isomerase
MINTYAPVLKEIASAEFDRIVFLGSGCLKAIARESHLKVQELSDGVVVGIFDSYLGFRHGPKAVVKEKTLLVFLFSPDKTIFRYEKDLAEELIQEDIAMDFAGVFSNPKQAGELKLKNSIIFNGSYESSDADFDILPYVIPAQILGYYKSINLGLNPDVPSENGSISRVVKGVTIYP